MLTSHMEKSHRQTPKCVTYNFASYRAAGLIPISIDEDDDLCILLGVERRKNEPHECLIDIGGRIEDQDRCSKFATAIREFSEETNKAFDACITLNRSFVIKKIYCDKSKYVSFLIYMEYSKHLPKMKGTSLVKVKWVKLRDLLRSSVAECIHPRLQLLIECFWGDTKCNTDSPEKRCTASA